jgi:hypothetical protein
MQDQIDLCDNEIEGVLQVMVAQKREGINKKIPDLSYATTGELLKTKINPASMFANI